MMMDVVMMMEVVMWTFMKHQVQLIQLHGVQFNSSRCLHVVQCVDSKLSRCALLVRPDIIVQQNNSSCCLMVTTGACSNAPSCRLLSCPQLFVANSFVPNRLASFRSLFFGGATVAFQSCSNPSIQSLHVPNLD